MDKNTKIVFIICVIIILIMLSIVFMFSKNSKTINNYNTDKVTNVQTIANNNTIIQTQALPDYVIKNENYMTFNMSISDFVKKYNEISGSATKFLQASDFEYIGDIPYENSITLKSYLYNQTSNSILEDDKGLILQVAPNEKIASIRYLSTNDIYANDIVLKKIINIVINKDTYTAETMIKNSKDNFENTIKSEDLHFGYQYWKINEVLVFELFAI